MSHHFLLVEIMSLKLESFVVVVFFTFIFSYDFWGLMLCIQTLKLEAILIVTQCVCHFEDEKTRDRYPRV